MSEHSNRPGLPAIAYRLGTHAGFFRRMLAGLPAGLTARALDDPSIALADAWAVTADVLAFYQERIANEGYLRTATERRSVLEMARAIGYELSPGVAASTWLAFTVDESPGAPGYALIPKGVQVKSVPPPEKLPQTFETLEAIEAKAAWNSLKPLSKQAQTLALSNLRQVLLSGADSNLKAGDLLLVVLGSGKATFTVRRVEIDSVVNQTRVILSEQAPQIPAFSRTDRPAGVQTTESLPFTQANIETYVVNRRWRETDLQSFLTYQGWSADELLEHVNRTASPAPLSNDAGLFRFKSRLGFFGNNAPPYKNVPKPAEDGATLVFRKMQLAPEKAPLFSDPDDWDAGDGRDIWEDSGGHTYTGFDVYLERPVPGVLPDSWVVFEMAGLASAVYRVETVTETSLADYALSGRATGLNLKNPARNVHFKTRRTTAHVESEPLRLADLPVTAPVPKGDKALLLDRMVLGLSAGRKLALSGESYDAPGVAAAEIVELEDIVHQDGLTELQFRDPLKNSYVRATATLNANLAPASHGESVRETLGSGDASQANQRFLLKKNPLTYISASSASGGESTLEVRAGDVLWQEAASLYGLGPADHNYIVRIDDDAAASIVFGDGEKGARLPSGQENVSARYRSGIGPDGEVGAGSLTLLQSLPLGVRSVSNPLEASGAAAPEKLDAARINAPRVIRTLDRIVSLKDFEDFARGFAGIGKARASTGWSGEERVVKLVVATGSGKKLNDKLYDNLCKAIGAARDPVQPVEVTDYQPVPFGIEAGVFIDPAHDGAKVLAAVRTALTAAFGYDRRDIGEMVTAAAILAVIQPVEGVVAVDLNQPGAFLQAGDKDVLFLDPRNIKLTEKKA